MRTHDTSLPDCVVIHRISHLVANQATDFHVQCPALTLSPWTRPCELDAYFWDVFLGLLNARTLSQPFCYKQYSQYCQVQGKYIQPPCISVPFLHSLFSTALPACFGPSSPYRHESHAASTHLETNDNWSPAFFVEAVPDASCDTNDQGKCYPYRFSSRPSIPPSLPGWHLEWHLFLEPVHFCF